MVLVIAGYAAVGILVLSLAAKMYMSFAVRVPEASAGYAATDHGPPPCSVNGALRR